MQTTETKISKRPKRKYFWCIFSTITTFLILFTPVLTSILVLNNFFSFIINKQYFYEIGTTIRYMNTKPITNIFLASNSSECPTGFEIFTPLESVLGSPFVWPGSRAGCKCDNGKDYINSFGSNCNTGCRKLPNYPEQRIKVWKSFKYCYKREGVSSLERPMVKNGQCPVGFKVCGSICQTSTADCPITSLSITTQNTGVLYDPVNNLYLEKNYSGSNLPIIYFEISSKNTTTREKFWECRNGDSALELSTCHRFSNDPDYRFKYFDEIDEKRIFQENGIPEDFAVSNQTFKLLIMNELEWGSHITLQDLANFQGPMKYLSEIGGYTFLLSIIVCCCHACLVPCVLMCFGKWCELWCLPCMTFDAMIRLKIVETFMSIVKLI
jgi:hypothetical protein